MKDSFKISCKIALAVLLVAAVFLTGCGVASRGGGTPLNPTKPTVVYEVPGSGSTGVKRSTRVIITFSVQMDPSTLTASQISLTENSPGGTPVTGEVATDPSQYSAVFTPAGNLSASTTYFVNVTTGVKSIFGVAMATPSLSTFRTGTIIDVTTPEVSSTDPPSFETGVRIDKVLSVVFDEDMDPTTASSNTFILRRYEDGVSVEGLVNCVGPQVTFNPLAELSFNTTYEATLTTGFKCAEGVPLASEFVWTFETESTGETSQDPVDLKTAGHFAVLASASIQNTGNTLIDGASPYWGTIGVSPYYSVNGFPPGVYTGGIYIGSGTDAGPAQLDLHSAYIDAQNRTSSSPHPKSGDVGGQTFTPGLYTSSNSLSISSGNLTFNALGNSDAVFIIQVGGNLTVSNNRSIILTGSAEASNIFWQVGGSVTIGTVTPATTGTFNGIILANSDITMNSGSSLIGRALTLGGTVHLNTCTVTAP